MIYLELFWTFLKIGAFTFGGGYAMLPLIQAEVLSHGWMDASALVDFIAVSESTPGPFAINIATYVGAETGGIGGALCATLGVVLPSFVCILIVARCFEAFRSSFVVQGCMTGLKPAVVGLIGASVLSVAATVFVPSGIFAGHIRRMRAAGLQKGASHPRHLPCGRARHPRGICALSGPQGRFGETQKRGSAVFSLANVVPLNIFVPRSAFSRMAGRAARRAAVSRQTKYGRPPCRTASRFFIIASPRYIQTLKRDASRQRPALPLSSLRLKEQRSRQPLGKTDGRRLSADSVRASVPPHSTGGKIPFRSFLHSLHARRRVAGHLPFTAFPMRVPADMRPAAPSQRRRKRKEVRRFPRLRSYGIRFASIPVLLYAIHGLLVGKSIKFKLIDQPVAGKGAGLQIAFRLFSGLLVPIGAAVLDGKNRIFMRILFKFKLLDQALIRKRKRIQISFGRFQSIGLPGGQCFTAAALLADHVAAAGSQAEEQRERHHNRTDSFHSQHAFQLISFVFAYRPHSAV